MNYKDSLHYEFTFALISACIHDHFMTIGTFHQLKKVGADQFVAFDQMLCTFNDGTTFDSGEHFLIQLVLF